MIDGTQESGTEAIKWLHLAAAQGSAAANYRLAQVYGEGYYVPSDFEKAEEFATHAMRLGSVAANYYFASKYIGEGKFEAAEAILRRLATAGDSGGQLELARHMMAGTFGEKDEQEALKLLMKAAMNNNLSAQYSLGLLYLQGGETIEKDPAMAKDWLLQAAYGGDSNAIQAVLTLKTDSEHAGLITQADVQNLEAQSEIAKAYLLGNQAFGPDDQERRSEAIKRLSVIAAAGDPLASYYLAYHLLDSGLADDQYRAFELFQVAAAAGNITAANYLVELYFAGIEGYFVPAPQKAVEILQQIQSPQSEARIRLASAALEFNLEPPYTSEWGIAEFEEMAKEQWPEGIRAFAYLHLEGRLVERDYEKAIALYETAIGLDDIGSMNAFAWFLATCPEAQYRDGDKAVELVKQALEREPEAPAYIDTYAAALATSGDFEAAVEQQELAVQIADSNGWYVEDMVARLELFRAGEIYLEHVDEN